MSDEITNEKESRRNFPLPVTAMASADKNDTLVQQGVHLFYIKGCEYCHNINHYGGNKGPDLTTVGNRLSAEQLQIRIVSGGDNMPSYGGILNKDELNKLVAFLELQK